MKNTIETYGMICKQHKSGLPIYIVGICSTLLASTQCFSSCEDAEKYLESEKARLSHYAINLQYAKNYHFPENIVDYILSGNNLYSKIENHCMYCKG